VTWNVEFARHYFIASLWLLYCNYQVWREKNVVKPAPGKRRCNCRNEVYHRQIGPGMFQQMTEQVKCISEDVDIIKFLFILVHFLGCIFYPAYTLTSSINISWLLLYCMTVESFFFLIWFSVFYVMCWRGLRFKGLLIILFLISVKVYTSISDIYLSRSVTNVLMSNT
jgi:hypothetical protein